ncbi:MAG: DNA internalization-related competence protein ComEC/Rec2 [Gammaproteobacteria bacterium]
MLALAGGMLSGAGLALRLPGPPPAWLCTLLLLGAGAAWLRARCLSAGFAAGVAAGFCLAAIALGQALADRLAPSLDATQVEFVGIVEDLPQHESRRLVVTLRIESPKNLPRRVRLAWYEPAATPRPGERWRFQAKLQRPRGVLNSGSGSREAWLLRQRIGATGYASGPAGGERLAVAADRLLDLRGRGAAQIQAAVEHPQAAAVLIAISLGFRGGLDTATREALAATGTGHLLAISGLHVGLAAAAGGLLGGALGRRFGMRWRPARDWAALGALAAAGGYCLLAGMPVSARRAVLMTAAGLAALVIRRGASLAAAFGGALALVLVADPLAVLDPGLWLSFGAVATILAVVAGRLAPAGGLAIMLRIQAALAVGLLVCTVAWFGRVSLVAPLANLAAVPWFSILVVPPALAGVVVSWVSPWLGGWLLMFAAKATELALLAIQMVAGWPMAARNMAAPGTFALACAGAGAAWCLLPRPAPGRLLAPLLFAPLLLTGPPPLATGAFELRVFDIGHGLAVLVRTEQHVLLYDAGPAWPGGDAAAWTVLPAMRALGLRRLDALVISHGHADHMGGARSVLAAFPGTPRWNGFGAEQERGHPCRAGQSWAWDGVRFSILHPPEGFVGGANEGSCVLLIEGPGGRVLLTGDIETRGERALLTARGRLPVDLVVAPHHGSRTSSAPPLVAATQPAWVVFSTNWRNRWGFPAEAVVARWRRAGALPLSTERHGEIVVRFDRTGPRPPVVRRHSECRAWLDCATLP